ncbi:hypothetical protein [Halolactibacillus sp. JCM 19043]|uniref:hypothetical protein n=1 Tax=Halolactibacillus sp. JCM 19043 TaxID=1460638 RepID=UPI0012E219CD|nr:hypothetical protein [Halolactibacillus sp. JCM 19043]
MTGELVKTYTTTFTTESSDSEDDVDDDEDAPVVETNTVSLQLFDEDQTSLHVVWSFI